ncbi:MAG: ATP-dependent zinc metalloprotease FtsH [Ruminococcaceae bacterium]|nr:ATP-dependent zinc metalloprotease FtsH [Oscillospiraceae bacterium]
MSDKGEGNSRPRFGGLFFYVIMLVILVVFSTLVFGNNYGKKEQAKLSDVLNYIDNKENEVELVEVKGTIVTVRYKNDQGQIAEISQSIPYEYVDDLIGKLEEAKSTGKIKDFNYTEPFDWSIILNIGSLLLAAIIIIVLFINISRQSKEGSSVFSFGNNRARVSDPNKIKVKFSDVAGSVEEKEELSEIVDFLKNPKKYKELGAKIPKGVLLYGAPGTGKTLLARAVAGEAGVKFFYISGSDFVEMLVGVGASRVRSLFADAKREAPSVVFIDEIDAVGRKRGAGLGGGQDEREQTLNQILVEMDGFDVNSNIIVMAATNRVDVLDPALLRPGRFDRRIMVNMPDADEREAILKIHAKNKPLAKDVSLREVALSTVGFTGADLENLLNEAALMTARHNKKEISMLEVTDAMFRVQMGPQKNSKKLSDKVKRLTAYHEAGHAVVLRATSEFEKVDRVTIIPAGQAGGYTAYKPIEDTDFYTEKMLLDTIKMSLGGRAAEEIFLGEVSTGASSDLRHCNDIAKNMIKRYGLSKKFRNMVFGDENEEVFLGYSMGQVQSYSEKTAAEIDAEIKLIIDECYAETKRILIEKQAVVEGLAQRLIKKLTVDGPDFEKIYINDGDLSKVYPDEYTAEVAAASDIEPEAPAAEEAPVEAEAAPVSESAEEAPTWPAEAASRDYSQNDHDPGPTD